MSKGTKGKFICSWEIIKITENGKSEIVRGYKDLPKTEVFTKYPAQVHKIYSWCCSPGGSLPGSPGSQRYTKPVKWKSCRPGELPLPAATRSE